MTRRAIAAMGDARGLSLVEILIAVGVLGVGLAALAASIPFATYGIQEGNQLSTATFLANQRLEQVRSARWEEGPPCIDWLGLSASSTAAPAGTCAGATGVTFPDESAVAAPYANYARRVRITDCGVGAGCGGIVNSDLRQVTVTVTYRAMTGTGLTPTGSAKATAVTMYVARR